MYKDRPEKHPSGPLPEGAEYSSWEKTTGNFVWELLDEYHFRSAGGSANPEKAFANIRKIIKEDLHRSVSNLFYHDCDRRLMNLRMWQ